MGARRARHLMGNPKLSWTAKKVRGNAHLSGTDWQNRALEPIYPIDFLDALRIKIRDAENLQVQNQTVFVASGVTSEGKREVLGL